MSLFEHYPADSAAAETAGNDATNQKDTFDALRENLSGQTDKASQEAGDTIKLPVEESGEQAKKDAEEAGAASLVAGGAMKHFATAIQTYNDHIDELNEEYEAAKADDFGVAADAGYEDGNTDAENETARDELVAEARSEKKAELEEKRAGYEGDLDDSADFAASMLVAGPSEETVLSLVATGDIDIAEGAAYLGATVASLNEWRAGVGVTTTIRSWKTALPALLKKDWAALRKALEPGNLLGKDGTPRFYGKHQAAYKGQHRIKPLRGLGKTLGRVMPPLALVSGSYGLGGSMRNITEDGGDFDDWNNAVGSTGAIISGGIGTAALCGLAVPGPGWAVAGVAGAVAVGSWVIDNREEIGQFAEDVGSTIGDAAEATGDFLASSFGW